jgi:hypothetical protein
MNYKTDILAAGERLSLIVKKARVATTLGDFREAERLFKQVIDEAEHAKQMASTSREFEEKKLAARYLAQQEVIAK